MTFLCAYKDALGAPRTGVHSVRLFDVAVVDTALAFALVYVLFGRITILNTAYVMLLGCLMHAIFCVKTKVLSI